MDQQLHDSSTFERAFAVAQQRHKETVSDLHRLREEHRERDVVIKRLQANLGDRFDAELECRLLKDQLKKIQEGMQQVVGEDERRQHEDDLKIKEDEAASGEINASTAKIQLAKKGSNCVAKLSLEYLADILGYLDRFSLDRVEFTCPKLRAAVATLDGQNYRDLIRLEVTRAARDENGRRVCGRGRGGFFGRGASGQHRQIAQNSIAIVVECSSDPMAMKNGATSANGMLDWDFVDTPKATAHFIGLLRNANVRQMSLANPTSHQFIQALSDVDVDVVVGSLSVGSFSPEAAILAVGRDSLIPFNRLEKLSINNAPLDLLSDDLLLAATQKRVMSITLKSDHFRVRVGGRTIEAPVSSECIYSELCDGVLAFLFRKDLDDSDKVELRFPAARIPEDFCQHLLESAISAGTRYSIDASFVAVGDINDDLVGFEEYRRLAEGYDNGVVAYRVRDPNTAHITLELKIATVSYEYDDWGAPTTVWKLIEFRRL